MHFNVLSLSFSTLWLLCLPPTPFCMFFFLLISLLNKGRQKDYADKFNKDKLKDLVGGQKSE